MSVSSRSVWSTESFQDSKVIQRNPVSGKIKKGEGGEKIAIIVSGVCPLASSGFPGKSGVRSNSELLLFNLKLWPEVL